MKSTPFKLLAVAILCLGSPITFAAPWAEPGDSFLRSDFETLAAAGVLDDITFKWPLPWERVLGKLSDARSLDAKPEWVREAAERLKTRAEVEMTPDSMGISGWIDGTNAPDPVRGFDASGRQDVQGQGVLDWNRSSTAVHLAVGAQSHDRFDHETAMLDGSYIAQQFAGAALYAGWLNHWWGPGWVSALSESTNARPIPQIGISRLGSAPFETRWLHWLGPWQAEFFFGVLDGPRIQRNTYLNGLEVSFNPLPGFEWGFERMDEACGHGHPCDLPQSWFNATNSVAHPSDPNDQLDLDFKYTRNVGPVTLSAYMQVMNEDSNPLLHSGSSHLFGLTGWAPVAGTRVRFTAEFTDTIPTVNIFSFGDYLWGVAYNDYKYPDGLRYRGRDLGFSLDSDSKLVTLQAAWTGWRGIGWTLSYNHAQVSVASYSGYYTSLMNPLSSVPVTMDIGEARATVPLNRFTLDLSARYQSNQLRPAHGGAGAAEARISYAIR